MRKIPRIPAPVVAEQRRAVLDKWIAQWPELMDFAAHEAEFLRQKKAVFVLAGFTDDQAMQLILRK